MENSIIEVDDNEKIERKPEGRRFVKSNKWAERS